MNWLSIPDAARVLGVSPDTVRRRIRRGQLVGEKEPAGSGYVWRVQIDAELDPADLVQDRERSDAVAVLQDELRARREENARLLDVIAYLVGVQGQPPPSPPRQGWLRRLVQRLW